MDTALQQPVLITKHNRRSVVILSDSEYQSLNRLREEALKAQVTAGFDQLDQGIESKRTPRQIAQDVRAEFGSADR